MHIGFSACFHAISLERNRFSKIATYIFLALVALKLLVSLISRFVACSAIAVDTRTHTTTTAILAAHARAERSSVNYIKACMHSTPRGHDPVTRHDHLVVMYTCTLVARRLGVSGDL